MTNTQMRIAYGGFLHETNTFSTLVTQYDDFRVVRDQALFDSPFWQEAVANGHRLFPLFVAHATPGGRVTRDCFQRFLDELLGGLQACLPLDGLLLELHGAMEVEEIGDGETALLKAVRDRVGPKTFISVTLDLHANLSPEVVACSDLLNVYRTAPHRDVQETQERGARLMIECLQDGIRPYSHLIKLPLLLAGEAAVTEVEPARSLFAR
ncbi:MAG: M81 family metallopeptidase, partial [Anaerolineae bacterium]|nr:M81 family metallopeptidase [Anaerolineae bacterium]